MSRLYVFLLSVCCAAWPSVVFAQHVFEAIVADAQTHEVLPFATIYINNVSSTISNSQGAFAVKCDSDDVVRISYVGYRTLQLKAAQLSAVVSLSPVEQTVGEVTILPIHLKKFIQKTTKETLRQLQKNRKQTARFFYRQTAFARDLLDSLQTDSICNELVEAFLSGSSAVSLRDLQLLAGRYAAIKPDSVAPYAYYRNFYTYSQIEIALKSSNLSKSAVLPPLFPQWEKVYDVDYDIAFDESGARLILLRFEPKPNVRRALIAGTVYVDEQTFHVRRIVGRGVNNLVAVDFWVKGEDGQSTLRRWVIPSHFTFDIHMTEERGFVEVQSVFIRDSHDFDGFRISTSSTLYNVGDSTTSLERMVGKKGTTLEFYGHLHNIIDSQNYDPAFWRDNEIVHRTPVEQQVQQLFEEQNLFGVWK